MNPRGDNPWTGFRVEKEKPLRRAGPVTIVLLLLAGLFMGGVAGLFIGLHADEPWGIAAIAGVGALAGLFLMARFLFREWLASRRK